MGYNCVVCAKQVPDTKRVTGEAMRADGTVNRGALPAVFNPEDLNALEEALSIRDRHGGTVTVLTMGPPSACEILRDSLFRGADRAVLLTDRRAGGSDTLATSYVLACAVPKLAPDIVLCGRQAIDGDTAQVGPQLAQKLGFTLLTYLEELIDLADRTIRVRRNIGTGWEVASCRLPVLLTVMGTANQPRPYAARRLMKYKRARAPVEVAKEVAEDLSGAGDAERAAEARRRCEVLARQGLLIEQWDLADAGADPSRCGLSNSPTKVARIQAVVLTGGEYHEYEPTDRGVAELTGALIEDHTIG